MDTQHKLNPKFFFLSVGVLVTLITSIIAFLKLSFEIFSKQFPDVLNATYSYGYNTYSYETLRAQLATLIIAFPVFLILSYFWNTIPKKSLGKIDSIIRKWMLYIVLFLAAVVIVVDLIVLVKYFVAGEITQRFILKVIITFLVGLIVGSYYKMLVQEKGGIMGKATQWVYAGIALVLVAGSVVWSFCITGSPMTQRKYRLDDRRISDLQTIQWQLISYWQQKSALPNSLRDLNNPLQGFSLPVDPEFEKGLAYEYKKTDTMRFELCATFSLPMPKGWNENGGYGIYPMGGMMEKMMDTSISYPYPTPGVNDSWDHQAGRTCFSRVMDPDIYPPYETY